MALPPLAADDWNSAPGGGVRLRLRRGAVATDLGPRAPIERHAQHRRRDETRRATRRPAAASGGADGDCAGRHVIDQIEGVTNILSRLPSLARILRQALLQHAIERSRRHRRHRRGFPLQNGGDDTARVLSVEGATARQHLVEHQAEREESLRASAGLPCACSGDMYCTVPRIMCSPVSGAATVGDSDGASGHGLAARRAASVSRASPARSREA